MENLTIVSTTTNVQAKEVIGENTVIYSYNFEEGKAPLAVVFNLQRKEGQMSGTYYPNNGKFDVNTTAYQPGDGALQEQIFTTCKNISDSLTLEEPVA